MRHEEILSVLEKAGYETSQLSEAPTPFRTMCYVAVPVPTRSGRNMAVRWDRWVDGSGPIGVAEMVMFEVWNNHDIENDWIEKTGSAAWTVGTIEKLAYHLTKMTRQERVCERHVVSAETYKTPGGALRGTLYANVQHGLLWKFDFKARQVEETSFLDAFVLGNAPAAALLDWLQDRGYPVTLG